MVFTTNMQKAYLSIQASFLSAFAISKTHISGQMPRRRQLNAKVCDSKSAIFRLLFFSLRLLFKLKNSSSTHLDFSTKQMPITVCSFPTTQRLHSLKFTLVDKSHSQHSVAVVRCEGHHFLMLYACAHCFHL